MIRKGLTVLAIVLLGLWVAHDPAGASSVFRHLGAGLAQTAVGVGVFFTKLVA